ncbi:MAG: hypothetical protein GY822_07150 [Deltaproteobacteria bacterium]|nr:hypothetical protein [Deltaproteobacteria bacterium]
MLFSSNVLLARCFSVLALVGCSIAMVGCGDSNRSTGEMGNLEYSLFAEYILPGTELVDTPILVGHPQTIRVYPTSAGSDQLSSGYVVHNLLPTNGATLTFSDREQVADLVIDATLPGTYTIESKLDGEVFDRTQLTFEAPTQLEIITWVRAPQEDAFVKSDLDVVLTEEGTQVALLPIPLNASGDRIAGDFIPSVSADREGALVFNRNVLGIYEQQVASSSSPTNFYLVESGQIVVQIADSVNNIVETLTFNVSESELP